MDLFGENSAFAALYERLSYEAGFYWHKTVLWFSRRSDAPAPA